MDELKSIIAIHKEQKRWRLMSLISFIIIIIASSFVFVIFSREVSGVLVQVLMILTMFSIMGLVFLDRVSYQLNKKFYKQNITSEYLFKHLKPEDMYTDSDILVELIKDRHVASMKKKFGKKSW